ncbi:hypothetical protein SLEP1_g59211 [Rubroshorea leprosula]|uniref:Uncharacterized protein n=1 Tax=Rubroshorea leprosula TaxID=152421 RepID=A0AAV5MT75_9ROSI|nr:hypothetical protein SLEP1_g59211 [Rubroshorea leprosula]
MCNMITTVVLQSNKIEFPRHKKECRYYFDSFDLGIDFLSIDFIPRSIFPWASHLPLSKGFSVLW